MFPHLGQGTVLCPKERRHPYAKHFISRCCIINIYDRILSYETSQQMDQESYRRKA